MPRINYRLRQTVPDGPVPVGATASMAYVRRVYGWLMTGVLLCCAGAWGAFNIGLPVQAKVGKHVVEAPMTVGLIAEHPYLACFGFMGLALIVTMARRIPGVQTLAFVVFTTFTGMFFGPAIFAAQLAAHSGHTLSGHPVRDAFVLTMCAFGGLTGYVMVSKRDFSTWGSALVTGLWVLIGALVLSIFTHSSAFDLAISSVAVLLFAGFIVFDTWRVLNRSSHDDAIGDALALFLDLANLFLHLLRILGGGSKSD